MKLLLPALFITALPACAGGPTEAEIPADFDSWLADLPATEEFTPYHATMDMRMAIDVIAMAEGMEGEDLELEGDEELAIDMTITAELDCVAKDRLRCAAVIDMDMGTLGGEIPGPMEVAVLAVADGETLWLEPEYRTEWLREEVEDDGGDTMVFTLKLATVLEVMEAFAATIDKEMPDAFGEGGYLEMVRQGQDLAAWVHTVPDGFVVVEGFAVEEDAVILDIVFEEEMMALLSGGPDMPAMEFTDYRVICDRATGAVRSMTFGMAGAGMQLDSRMQIEVREVGDFPEGHFTYSVPEGHTTFPLDSLVGLVIGMLAAEIDESEEDYEF